jgi:hypothetical protein
VRHRATLFAALAAGVVLQAGLAQAADIPVSFDIKPQSCPNPLYLHQSYLVQTLSTAILGTDSLDVNDINMTPGDLVLVVSGGGGFRGAIIPIQIGYEDVATPVFDPGFCECTTDGPDGFYDLTLHFDRDEVEQALGSVSPGDFVQLCIQGSLNDGTTFEGCDCIWIVGPVPVEGESWGRIKGIYR